MPESADIAIIGAGAAGLMSAISAARENPGLKIFLLDTRQKIGAKILISGGTRCNVTNVRVTPKDYQGGPKHFVKHVLEAFTPDETRDFFEKMRVSLVLEPTGKYFPTTHSGKTVLDAFLKEIEKNKVQLKTGVRVSEVQKAGDVFHLKGTPAGRSEASFALTAKRVILATGGLSYPETGSDGTGLEIAKNLGHSIVKTTPALTPLTTDDEDWKSLTGITLEASLSFFRNEKKEMAYTSSFLFTHFGFSGPVALDVSRFVAGADKKDSIKLLANFLPSESEESFIKDLERSRLSNPGRQVKNYLTEKYGLPSRFVEVFFKKIGADERSTLKNCSKAVRGQLAHKLLNCPLEVTGVVGYKKAEVTAGGVDLKEVKAATMESKIMPGLYFTGEILDMDGRIGGFNFQWAWSTGTIAGRSAVKSLSAS